MNRLQGGPAWARCASSSGRGREFWSRASPSGATPEEARTLWKTGKYAEAQEAYEALAKAADLKPAAKETIALGLADCLISQGQPDKALATLKAVAPPSADVHARIADVLFHRGDWDGAAAAAKAARAIKDDHLQARWIEARLLESQGKLAPDGADWKWFIDYQNGHNDTLAKDPLGLLIVGQAAERYYRANATGQQLGEGLERRHQRRLRDGPEGRPRLLAGALARREALPLGLPGGGRPQGAEQGARDQPPRRRGPGEPRPRRPRGLQARQRPEAGRAGAGDQPEAGRGVRAAGRRRHLRREVHRGPRRRPEGRGREPEGRGRARPPGRDGPAPGRPRRRHRGRGRGPVQQPEARRLLLRPGRAAGRPPQVPLGRARLPARRAGRPEAGRRQDRPGDALHADRPRARGPRPLRHRLRRRPLQRPRQEHDEGAEPHGRLPVGQLGALHRHGRRPTTCSRPATSPTTSSRSTTSSPTASATRCRPRRRSR